ncbi:DUF3618 domain-containing protein [Nonomuraea coxensis]|nr:DUF3618 domain-containing protein [Nonomuraea coxensis]
MRSEIAATRAELAADVDRLADRTSPSRIARRRTEGVRRAARSFRERVMGTPSYAADRAHQGAGAVTHGAHQAAEAVRAAPEQAMRGTQGNPLAAGLIAFGAGLLAAALIPRTQAEEQAVGQLREQVGDVLEPVVEAGRESARQLGQEAREVAGQAAEQVRQTASEAAGETAQHAREQARQVTDHHRSA